MKSSSVATAVAVPVTSHQRLPSIDVLRGLVMVIMLLDHTRDFFHDEGFRFQPTDLTQTYPVLFFTRFVTHYCAPVFVFLAGVSVSLQALRGHSRREMAWLLLTRGLWLIVLEITFVRVGIWFNFDYSVFFSQLQVIWAIVASMVALAGLIFLPRWAVLMIGVVMIAGHNLSDGVRVAGAANGLLSQSWDTLWILLHQGGAFQLFGANFYAAYPLVPWVGVMATGYAVGFVYGWPTERRRPLLMRAGVALILLFVALRLLNVYGDPQPWESQPTPIMTLLSWLNVEKYPPSLLYLLVTLGPALWLLGFLEKYAPGAWSRPLVVLGRVPLFFYLGQWFTAHGLAVLLNAALGREIDYLFMFPPAMFTAIPPGAGFPLWVTYAAWLVGLLLLYPLCRWFYGVKQRRRDWWLSYL